MTYILLLVGFVLLIKGADFFVDGSSSVAKLLKVPPIIIGLTVVAFGTSMPEASVSITAAMRGENSLALSNILGSNIFNLMIVLGCSALMRPISSSRQVVKRELPFSIAITVLLAILCTKFSFGGLLDETVSYQLGRVSGVLLLVLFGVFLVCQVRDGLKARHEDDGEEYKTLSPVKSIVYIVGGLVAIVAGGNMVVESATDIAVAFGFSQSFIGLTIVAMGTSLPELVTSVVAAKKGENELALGNVVGSNIFNILFILGASAVLSPIAVEPNAIIDMAILVVMSILAYICSRTKETLSKKEGVLFLIAYAVYFFYIYTR